MRRSHRWLGACVVVLVTASSIAVGLVAQAAPALAPALSGTQKTLISSGLDDPLGVAVDSHGNVYVADSKNNRVVEVPNGGAEVTVGFNDLENPEGIAVDSAGDLYVVSDGNTKVYERTPGGVQTTLDFTDLSGPTGVAVDSRGDVFVADGGNGRIVELPPGGSQLDFPMSDLEQPVGGIAVDSVGDVFVVNSSARDIVELTRAGTQASVSISGLAFPTGVAVDGQGDLYVTDPLGGKVVELPTGGSQSDVAITGVSSPLGVAVDSSGNLYVTGTSSLIEYTPPPVPPTAPTIGAVLGANTRAVVSWLPPSFNGRAAISGYTVTPFLGSVAQPTVSAAGSASSVVVSGLTNGKPYTFRVSATNIAGTGPRSAASALIVPPLPTLGDFVTQQFKDFTGQLPTTSQLNAWSTSISGGTTPISFIANLRSASDATTNVNPTTRLYFAYFRRPPDQGGLDFWVAKKRAGESLYAISDYFAGSSEFVNTYGSLSNADFVTLVYNNVLGRAPDPSGDTYWVGQLNSGAQTRGQVMVGFSESHEYQVEELPSVNVAVTWIDMLQVSPGQSDFNTWVTNLTTGGQTVADLAAAIMVMPAYAGRFN